jgi:hypothetical protein
MVPNYFGYYLMVSFLALLVVVPVTLFNLMELYTMSDGELAEPIVLLKL